MRADLSVVDGRTSEPLAHAADGREEPVRRRRGGRDGGALRLTGLGRFVVAVGCALAGLLLYNIGARDWEGVRGTLAVTAALLGALAVEAFLRNRR